MHLDVRAINTLADIPELIKQFTKSKQCVIWIPSFSLAKKHPSNPKNLRLYPLTSTFHADHGTTHSGVPADCWNDVTGRTYFARMSGSMEQFVYTSNDFATTDVSGLGSRFMSRMDLSKVCGASFRPKSDSDGPWVVSIYRSCNCPNYDAQDEERLREFAGLLPDLLQRILGKDLQVSVQRVLDDLQPTDGQPKSAEAALKNLVVTIAQSIFALECTVVLVDHVGTDKKTYSTLASTIDSQKGGIYIGQKFEGLTGYVMETGESLVFHDLRNFQNPDIKKRIEEQYPGITWNDTCDIRKVLSRRYPKLTEEEFPSVSFIAIPIRYRDEIIGVIRCSHGTNPYYFTHVQKELLDIFSKIVSNWWMAHFQQMALLRKADIQQDAISINDVVRRALFEDASKLTAPSTTRSLGIVLSDLCDELVSHYKYFSVATYSLFGSEFRSRIYWSRPNKVHKTPLDVSVAKFLQDKFLESDESVQVIGITNLPEYVARYMNIMLNAQTTVSTCILLRFEKLSQHDEYGVMIAGIPSGFDDEGIISDIKVLLGIVSKLVSIFRLFTLGHKERDQALHERQKEADHRLFMARVIGHQIRSPIGNANEILDMIMQRENLQDQSYDSSVASGLHGKLHALRGCLSKAQLVGRSMAFYRTIDEGRLPVLKKRTWTVAQLKIRVREIALNNRAVENASNMGLTFGGDFERIDEVGYNIVISLAREFLDQVLDAVLSNAFKYGRKGSDIIVSGKDCGEFYSIKITNTSIPGKELERDDILHCFGKEWRKSTTSVPGSGIGLWMGDKLIRLAGGRIEAYPTKSEKTSFELFLSRKS